MGLGYEIGVVVLGVLIALTAESLWEGRQSSMRVESYLVAFGQDLDDAAESLETAIAAAEAQLEATEAFLDVLTSTSPVPDSAQVSGVYRPTPTIPMGALDALWETGDINLLDEGIRTEIVRYRATLEAGSVILVEFRVAGHSLVADLLEVLEDIRLPGHSAYGQPSVSAMQGHPRVIAIYRRHRESLRLEWQIMRSLANSVADMAADLEDM